MHCPALPEVEGATIALSNGNIAPSVATYTCDVVVPTEGDATRTCQADGSWVGLRRRCFALSRGTAVLTGVPGLSQNRVVTITGNPDHVVFRRHIRGESHGDEIQASRGEPVSGMTEPCYSGYNVFAWATGRPSAT